MTDLSKLMHKMNIMLHNATGGNPSKIKRGREFMTGVYDEACPVCKKKMIKGILIKGLPYLKTCLCINCQPLYSKHFAQYVEARESDEQIAKLKGDTQ